MIDETRKYVILQYFEQRSSVDIVEAVLGDVFVVRNIDEHVGHCIKRDFWTLGIEVLSGRNSLHWGPRKLYTIM